MLYTELDPFNQPRVAAYIRRHIRFNQRVQIAQAVHCSPTGLHVGEIVDASYKSGGVYTDESREVADNEDSLIDYILTQL